MTTAHAAQALFLAKQMVLCAVGLGFSTVSNKSLSMHDYAYPSIGTWDIKLNCKWTLFCQSFSAKLLTVLIHQTFLLSKFFLLYNIYLLYFVWAD